ncbi:hypothetical protein GDO86_013731 [Hymenochirus boettgeri]|uniref:Uncharacterized protein n=1 Tax=Hymenochirus boettgeri TaxID=247094 RepID=A0A8T2JQA4_9PIPI|nr:hypothetical protein GDO86_013731 [Hymenochirus boettgeri]
MQLPGPGRLKSSCTRFDIPILLEKGNPVCRDVIGRLQESSQEPPVQSHNALLCPASNPSHDAQLCDTSNIPHNCCNGQMGSGHGNTGQCIVGTNQISYRQDGRMDSVQDYSGSDHKADDIYDVPRSGFVRLQDPGHSYW